MSAETAQEQLRRERDELSATVQELAERLDVGARARDAAGAVRTRVTGGVERVVRSPAFVPVVSAVGAGIALVFGARLVRRR